MKDKQMRQDNVNRKKKCADEILEMSEDRVDRAKAVEKLMGMIRDATASVLAEEDSGTHGDEDARIHKRYQR